MNEVAAKKESLPSLSNLEEFAGQGTENITARDTKLPILKILYANSPVLDDSDGKFNEKARQGDIYNEITGSLYKGKEGVYVVPCLYINTFNEWRDRGDSPGRPVMIHTNPAVMNKTNRGDDGKDRLENGNYIEDTGNHFVYILDKDFQPIETALITMKSTQKKKSKLWNSMMQSRRIKGKNGFFCPPSWASVYKLTTTKESNSQNSWYGWLVEFNRFLDKPTDRKVLEATKGFYKGALESDIFGKVDFSEDMNKQKSTTTEEVPF
tara:strand:- start:4978 stop:5775 length:798 start_codon:yes stop_codon:yes gene_type:complete